MITAKEYSYNKKIYLDVIITLLKNGSLTGERRNGIWYLNENQKLPVSKKRCNEIHIRNINRKILNDNGITIRETRILGCGDAFSKFVESEQEGYIYLDMRLNKNSCFFSQTKIEDDNVQCINYRIEEEGDMVTPKSILEVARNFVEIKRYNEFMIIFKNSNNRYATAHSLEEAYEKIGNKIAEGLENEQIKIYHKGRLIKKINNKINNE